jgi:hypothetical protein
VLEWIDDPRGTGRQIGWVTSQTGVYCRPIRRIAVRCCKKNGQWGVGVILSSLLPAVVLKLCAYPPGKINDPLIVLLAYVYFYDLRGGGVETEIKEDKQGLGTLQRNKKRFPAQQMDTQLEVLAHNTLVWARCWLRARCPRVTQFGMLRLVRDVCHMNGLILFDHTFRVRQMILNRDDPLAKELCAGLAA